MSNARFADWRAWFLAITASEEGAEGNRHPERFVEATSETLTAKERLQSITEDTDSVFLFVDIDKKVCLMHNLINFGGRRVRKEDKVVALLGMSHNAVPYLLEGSFWDPLIHLEKIPKDWIVDCETVEQLRGLSLTERANRQNEFITCKVCLPPPFALEEILNSGQLDPDGDFITLDPLELILLLKNRAEDLDAMNMESLAHGGAYEYTKYILVWLWLVHKGLIPPLEMEAAMGDAEAMEHKARCHARAILPPLGGGESDPFVGASDRDFSLIRQMGAALANLNETLKGQQLLTKKQIELSEDKSLEKKDRTKKFHPSIVHMLKMAASEDKETVADEIADSAKSFFNCSTIGAAEQELQSQLEAMGLGWAGFAAGLTTAMYMAHIFWANLIEPKNFSAFFCYRRQPNDQDHTGRFIVLHLQERLGTTKTLDEIKASMKQTLTVPKDFHQMLDGLRIFTGLNAVLDGGQEVSANLEKLTITIAQNQEIFQSRASGESKFYAAFVYAVDLRVQEAWRALKTIQDREDFDSEILNFSDLMTQVKRGNFQPFLPSCFVEVDKRKTENDGEGGDGSDRKRGRRNRRSGDDVGKKDVIKNEEIVPGWELEEYEDWNKHYRGKKSEGRPEWSEGCLMCHRFLQKGYCFPDCVNVASHVGASKIPADKKAKYQSWLDKKRAALKKKLARE
jgi:hypothetical protein